MIKFSKKEVAPAPAEVEENRFERIRKDAAEMHKKADTSSRDTTERSSGAKRLL